MPLILEVLQYSGRLLGGGTSEPGDAFNAWRNSQHQNLDSHLQCCWNVPTIAASCLFIAHLTRGRFDTIFIYVFMMPCAKSLRTTFNTHNWRDGVFDFVLGVSVQFSLCDTVMIIFIVMGNVLMLLLLERYVVIDNWNSQRLTFQVPTICNLLIIIYLDIFI